MYSLLHSFFGAIARFARGLRTQLATLTPDVVEITSAIRALLNNPALDVITTLTPDATDNALLVAVRGAFATLFPENAMLQKQPDVAAIGAHVKRLSKYSPDVRDAVVAKVAALVVRDRADLRQNEADLLVQMAVSADKAGRAIR